jgi:DUF4097 and DUF4098 domain-containing protein YvlB
MNDNGERYPNPSEIRHRIGETGQLTINNVSGDIELRAVDGDEVTVVAQTQSMRSEALPITVYKGEGSLTIDVEKRGGSFAQFGTWFGLSDGLDFHVDVPRAARVTINSVSADIGSHFLSGEQSYKSVSGDIAVDPDGGKLNLQTVSGDIEVRAAEPIELSVNTTSGDVKVEGAVVNRFDARTVSGDIQYEAGFGVGPVHTIETVSGDISIETYSGVTVEVKSGMNMRRGDSQTQVAGDGAAQVRFRTLSGDCHVLGAHDVDDGRRGRKHGKHDRFERDLERRIHDQVNRSFGRMPKDIDFTGGRPPMPPAPPTAPTPPMPPSFTSEPPAPGRREPADQLEVLRALERGEIDVEEASRRLQEA